MDLSSIHLKVGRCFDLIEISTKCFKNMLEPFYKVEKCKFFYFAFVFHVKLFLFSLKMVEKTSHSMEKFNFWNVYLLWTPFV